MKSIFLSLATHNYHHVSVPLGSSNKNGENNNFHPGYFLAERRSDRKYFNIVQI